MPEVGCLNYSTRGPVGVAGIIAPWNLPLYLLTFKARLIRFWFMNYCTKEDMF